VSLEAIIAAYAAVTAVAAIYILTVTALNEAWLLHTGLIHGRKTGDLVSILIPARNEEARIRPCLDSLIAQDYENREIIVYDDDSTDGTGKILDDYAEKYPKLVRVIHGKGLEKGWFGKPHAMQRLSEAASGAWLYFTDADTIHNPDSLGSAIGQAEFYKADLVSGYVRHTIGGFGEAQVLPSIYLLSMIAMPLWLIHLTKAPLISHAIGQTMLFRTEMYRKAGGYTAVKNKVSEDVRIARLVKKEGGKVLFVDLKDWISCRMYENYEGAIAGLSKNVYDYFNKNIFVLIAATIAVPLIFFVPIIGAVWVPGFLAAAQPHFRLSFMLCFYAWVVVTMGRMLPWYVPLIYPLILVNVLSTAWRAARIFSTGKSILWKGRMVK
jgi:chlorobactene glucosyltransferase